jgi:D-galactarolactone cycloisomerase
MKNGHLRIVRLRGFVVSHRLAEPQGNASGYYDLRSSLVVELEGENGVSGWGETWHSPQPCAALIRHGLGQAVLGADARNPRALVEALGRLRGYDRGGLTAMAISALEMAAYDLAARSEGRPIYALLGGSLRDRVGAYAAGPYFKPGGDPYRAYPQEATEYLRTGFRAIKAKIGVSPSADEGAVAALRKAGGDDVALMVDANQGLTAAVALETARRLVPHRLTWLEEPVPPEDFAGYRRIAQSSPVPISAGEALGELGAFATLLASGVSVVQPDLSVCGGFLAALDIAALAKAEGAVVVPHVWGTGINLHATLQLLALLPAASSGVSTRFPWLEVDRSPNPLRTLWGEPAVVGDGTVSIPDGPGLGIDIKREDFVPFLNDHWMLEESR